MIVRSLPRPTFGLLRYIVLAVYGLTTLVPFVWLFLTSFKTTNEMYSSPFGLPQQFELKNYASAWNSASIGAYFFNSLFVSVTAVTIILVFGLMAAYVLARVQPNLLLYNYFTLGIVIPSHTILIPTFVIVKATGLYNSLIGLIVLYAASNIALAIFVLVGFLRGIPAEIEEAALIDGCSRTRAFFQIIFPLSRPGLATVGILTFLNCWNEYLFAYILITDNSKRTITQGIYALQGTYSTEYGPLFAGLMMAIIPVVIIYLIFQEQVIEGMTAGSVKG